MDLEIWTLLLIQDTMQDQKKKKKTFHIMDFAVLAWPQSEIKRKRKD